jgi:hypothetical protein
MNLSDASAIAYHLKRISDILQDHSDNIYESICVDYDTDSGENFFISKLEEFLEIGAPYTLQLSDMPDHYPYEFISILNGIEVRCVCTKEDLDRCNIINNLPEIPQ